MSLSSQIISLIPQIEFVEFVDQYDDWQDAWDECPRGDWMLWLLGRLSQPIAIDDLIVFGISNQPLPLHLETVDLLDAAIDCAYLAKDAWPVDTIFMPMIAIVNAIDRSQADYYTYRFTEFLELTRTSLKEFTAWVKRGGGNMVKPTFAMSIAPFGNFGGRVTNISVVTPGANVGNRPWIMCSGPAGGTFTGGGGQVNWGVISRMVVQAGEVKRVDITTQQIYTSDPSNSQNLHRCVIMDSTDISLYTITASARFAYGDLYFMMKYMEEKLQNFHTRARAEQTQTQDVINAGYFATRAMCYACFVARAHNLTFCGGIAYDAAKAMATVARSVYVESVQAAIAGFNIQLAQYRATPNNDTLQALTNAIATYKAAVETTDATYKRILDATLLKAADIVRGYFPVSPI